MNILYNPTHLYNLNTISFHDILYSNADKRLYNYFWNPNHLLTNKLYDIIDKLDIKDNIIDIGCSDKDKQFKKATHLVDYSQLPSSDKIVIKLDLDFDKFQYEDNYFNFAFCRHTLEDIQNPQNAFNEIIRISKSGYIETPSPLVELTKYIDGFNTETRGYIHHRYIVWTDISTNTLHFLPKYPIVENIEIIYKEKYNYLLNNYPVYWNNYYVWDDNKKPNIIVYRNDINMDIIKDYGKLLNEATISSIENTTEFINYLTSSSTTNIS